MECNTNNFFEHKNIQERYIYELVDQAYPFLDQDYAHNRHRKTHGVREKRHLSENNTGWGDLPSRSEVGMRLIK